MIAGITNTSDRIKQINLENVKNREQQKEAVKHIQEEKPGDKITRPDGTGQNFDLGV